MVTIKGCSGIGRQGFATVPSRYPQRALPRQCGSSLARCQIGQRAAFFVPAAGTEQSKRRAVTTCC